MPARIQNKYKKAITFEILGRGGMETINIIMCGHLQKLEKSYGPLKNICHMGVLKNMGVRRKNILVRGGGIPSKHIWGVPKICMGVQK